MSLSTPEKSDLLPEQHQWICQFLDGTLSDGEVAKSSDRLQNNAISERIVKLSLVHQLLTLDASMVQGEAYSRHIASHLRGETPTFPGTSLILPSQDTESFLQSARTGTPRSLLRVSVVGSLLLMAIIIVGLIAPNFAPHFRSLPVGRVSRSVDVIWTSTAKHWSVGDSLHIGDRIRLDDGRISLEFTSGAVTTIVGPAVVEIRSTTQIALHQGTATTHINGQQKPTEFEVLTPDAEIVDLGTEFGVRVAPFGSTEVIVFDGLVDLRPIQSTGREKSANRRLSVGEAVRKQNGEWERLVSINRNAFPQAKRVSPIEQGRPPVILGITDDRRSTASPKYYQICHEGLEEDARAYVDRIYEWNGLTEAGLPYFLRGADYIQTFNDDKVTETPTIQVELQGPAVLYLLYDDRMFIPDWLSEAFEDTGYDIGLDEGGFNQERPLVGIGPGNSIDRVCSVWRRKIEKREIVNIGPIGKTRDPKIASERTMLGIAAQPISRSPEVTSVKAVNTNKIDSSGMTQESSSVRMKATR